MDDWRVEFEMKDPSGRRADHTDGRFGLVWFGLVWSVFFSGLLWMSRGCGLTICRFNGARDMQFVGLPIGDVVNICLGPLKKS